MSAFKLRKDTDCDTPFRKALLVSIKRYVHTDVSLVIVAYSGQFEGVILNSYDISIPIYANPPLITFKNVNGDGMRPSGSFFQGPKFTFFDRTTGILEGYDTEGHGYTCSLQARKFTEIKNESKMVTMCKQGSILWQKGRVPGQIRGFDLATNMYNKPLQLKRNAGFLIEQMSVDETTQTLYVLVREPLSVRAIDLKTKKIEPKGKSLEHRTYDTLNNPSGLALLRGPFAATIHPPAPYDFILKKTKSESLSTGFEIVDTRSEATCTTLDLIPDVHDQYQIAFVGHQVTVLKYNQRINENDLFIFDMECNLLDRMELVLPVPNKTSDLNRYPVQLFDHGRSLFICATIADDCMRVLELV